METTTTSTQNASAANNNVYGIVNDKIIALLEKGTVPWRQPWHLAGIPCNLLSRRPYTGINLMLLASLGYERNFFITYKQLQSIGGKVIRGEKGHLVCFWGKSTEENGEKPKPLFRYYWVFNVAQCENIPEDKMPPTIYRQTVSIEACENIVTNMPNCPTIQYKQHKAFYDPLKDIVNMPKQKTFESDEAYYSTLFHELVHSTGHRNRLNRPDLIQMSEFGSEPYSHEELVAEMGTCYLQSCVGIESQIEQSAAYIQNWLQVLKNDKKFIFTASAQAQKATDYILKIQRETDDDATSED